MNELIEHWKKNGLKKAPFKFETDNLKNTVEYSSYAEFIESADFGKSSSKFHLGLIPQPYIGNLANAKVIILMLNPGFSPGDYYAQENCPSFKQARIANLRQENSKDEYPFFYLNPEFAWTAGGQWWQNKFAPIARKLAGHENLAGMKMPYQKALLYISKHVACIELCPYFSKVYKAPKPALHSMQLALDYVKSELLERCEKELTSVVVLRQEKLWELPEMKAVFRLDARYARGAHLTVGNEASDDAGNFIYNKLLESLQVMN